MKPLNGFFKIAYTIAAPILRLIYPTEIVGLDRLPRERALLCANHSSNWDPVLLAMNLPVDYSLHIMAKEELFRFRPFAWLISKLGAFPVDRSGSGMQAIRTAMQVLKDGENLLIFTEGTTIRNGVGKHDGLPPHAHSGAAMIGIRSNAHLVPVFIDGNKRLFRRTRIVFGEPYTPVYTGRRGTAEELQKIADDMLAQSYALGGQQVGGLPL